QRPRLGELPMREPPVPLDDVAPDEKERARAAAHRLRPDRDPRLHQLAHGRLGYRRPLPHRYIALAGAARRCTPHRMTTRHSASGPRGSMTYAPRDAPRLRELIA